MIESLSIRSIGVISSANLELAPGFTALTGETGAGKTMVLTALGLLLGERADSSSVRTGEKQLFVEGRIRSANKDLLDRLEELGADVTGGEVIINRSVTSDGRSRAAIGGASVPISTLNEIAEELVTVHGQSDQLRLRSSANQREALDQFGAEEIAGAKNAYAQLFSQYRELEQRLERMRGSSEADAIRIQRLREQIADIEKVSPEPDELGRIDEQVKRLSNVESLRLSAGTAHDALTGDDGIDAGVLLGQARKALETSGDSKLQELAAQASEAAAIAADLAAELTSFLDELDADPAKLEQLMSRKAELVALERRYGNSADQLVELLPSLQAELLDLDSSDEQLEKLEMQFEATSSQLSFAAGQLTELRQKAGEQLAARVTQELSALAMGGSSLEVRVSPLASFEASGLDKVELLLAAHPGAEPRPLGKGASGGELSRIMLAIELVLSSNQVLPTMVFDEVDAGVGGAAAIELGKRLSQLAQSTQVIVVTHLPQVAAFADHQIRVSKDVSGEITESSVSLLSRQEREGELARMLSGNSTSEVALEHARELLDFQK
ncbi:MAG: DNA repair protein RecN [Candidatus Aquiluna sp. XM-24bin5]|nr:MAG: DNA repair protein RecN [Candidatus Aquiluna sp. XM-24bin5]